MAASMREVAALAGVSMGTISNVLNKPDVVSAATRKRVEAAIAQLGFVRNDAARQLRAGQSRMLAVVVLDARNPFFLDVAAGAESVADGNDLLTVIVGSGESEKRENRQLRLLMEQRVQGILLSPVGENVPMLDNLDRQGTPVVLLDRGSRASGRSSVAVDDVLGGRLAARHLMDLGHRTLVFVGGPDSIRQVRDRRSGALTAVAESASTRMSTVWTTSLSIEAGARAVAQIFDMIDDPPTGVVCANDLLALGVLQECVHRGVRVPEDLAIVGYDDIDYAAGAAVPLTSIAQPRAELGRAAAELLLEQVSTPGDHDFRQLTFDPSLVVRGSTDPSWRAH
ncbi:LacI family DNA-binding transcriptional regulator [Rhodococcus fascians]|nr:LacI family DNA-binding transcriptional regulator [Rhodococcus fascians]MBY3995249.1 LacI family DNA-binding transcriptional regulator [Rhodococcus fascians]MBY4000431.1 LacI family DNA-binding transcriptional regulator [Rhodococcus fascians]MBY4005459.1 LacI family DNA-binding transcriptional regulator [Rhodococcus fascians]MBY4016292.1 LacI family DNA-binding transcriptional regulator [Rhodococcus fascians]